MTSKFKMYSNFKRYSNLYFSFVNMSMKILLQSRSNFLIGLFSFLVMQFINIAIIRIVFYNVCNLDNWTEHEVILVFGLFLCSRGIDHLVTDYLWIFSRSVVKEGLFDKYLVRPINPLFHIAIERFQFDALGEIILGIVLLTSSLINLGIEITFMNIIFIVISVNLGAVIFTSTKILFSSLAFWLKDSFSLLQLFYNMSDFAKYPLAIYPKVIELFFIIVLPFAVTSYLPALFLLKNYNPFVIILSASVVTSLFFFMSYRLFFYGLRFYDGSGH